MKAEDAPAQSIPTSESVEEKVKRIIAKELSVQVDKVRPEASFVKDLGADSLDIATLAMTFEETFDIKFPEEEARKIRTVKDVVAYIDGQVGLSRPNDDTAPR